MPAILPHSMARLTDANAAKFLEHLRAETLHHKEKRASFTLQKLAFTTGLFGVAALQLERTCGVSSDVLVWILYLIPIVAVSYDVYIYAEDFKVKRVGTFIRDYQSMDNPGCISACEKTWENWLQGNNFRERFARWASLILTLLTAFAAAAVLREVQGEIKHLLYWLTVGLVIPVIQFRYWY